MTAFFIQKVMLTHPCVGRVEVAFDGTLPFRGWQMCLDPTAVIALTVLVMFNLSKIISEPKGILVDVTSDRHFNWVSRLAYRISK